MIQMGIDKENGEKKDKQFDKLSELLRKHYKPKEEVGTEEFWNELSKKIESLFHKEILSDISCKEDGSLMTDEERYWLGLEEYLKNEVSSLRHKIITDHILNCKECRKNYTDLLDKKKRLSDLLKINDHMMV